MSAIVECVPNFSEGRDASKIDAIVAAIRAVPGALLLDASSDPDHNRTVVTLAGEPEAVLEAALCAVGCAARQIDLRTHSGVHPRIGATDVLPFIPVTGISLEECASLAHRAGREIWERFQIPVYFYEAAALRPERVSLPNLRRGQFEGLPRAVLNDSTRLPDIGGPALHPSAGATAVGARKFLIAFNIVLNTADVEVARAIAKSVRSSSGGLPFVRAMGVYLASRNCAQVSLNLTDFEQTSLYRAFEAVALEAAGRGAQIAGSEIVGLVPRRAIESGEVSSLLLENFSPALVFEHRLRSVAESAPSMPSRAV